MPDTKNEKSHQQLLLTGPQLCSAGKLMGYEQLLLPEDPFRGWLVEDILAELARSKQELLNAKLITYTNSGEINFQSFLAAAITSLGSPDCVIMANYKLSKEAPVNLFLFQRDGSWLCLKSHKNAEYLLEGLGNFNTNKLTKYVTKFFNLEGQPVAPGKACSFTTQVYKEAIKLADEKDREACASLLLKTFKDESAASHLAAALSNPKTSGGLSLLVINGTETRSTIELAFLEGPDGLWSIEPRPTSPQSLEVAPVSVKVFTDRMNSLISEIN